MSTHNSYKKRREMAVIGVEPTPGVTATQQYAFRWLTKGVRTIPGILENESAIGLDARVNDSAIDVSHSEGPLGGKVTEDGIGYLNHGMFNKVVSVDNLDGTYTHTFTRDKNVARKSLSFWDVRPAGTRLFKSQYMDNLNLNVEVGDAGAWLEASTAFKGWKHEDVADIVPAFVVGEKEFTSRHVKLYIADNVAGLANLTASRVKPRSINLALEETATVDHSVGESDDDPEFDFAPQEARGSMVVKYKKTDFEDDYFNNAVHAMRLVIENNGVIVTYTATKVRFREVTDSDGRDDTVTQTISFYCEADETNGGQDIVSTVTNTVATYTP